MAYNELSLTGSDEDLGALETKYPQQDLVSQIPGQTSAARPQAPKSLIDRASAALMQVHPMMMGRSLVDTTKSFIGGSALPVVAPISAGVQALNAAPGNIYRRSRGEQEVRTPTAEELMRKYGEAVAPQTEMGENFIGGVGKLMEVLKVPHAFPLVPNAPRRPMLTPTDVRVGAGQAKQLAREVREVPQDFQNAQSGLKRQNRYGEDTLGVKAQAAAESLGDTLERRKSAGKLAIPGVPGQLVPETNLYAVRPGKGTSLIQPKVPETAKGYPVQFDQVNKMVRELYSDKPAADFTSSDVMSKYGRVYLEGNRDLRHAAERLAARRATEMFPDAPSTGDAYDAYEAKYSNQEAKVENQLSLIEEILNSPEGAAFREQGVPTPSEFRQRLAEAERVIKGPFVNYITKNVGAEGNPTLKLARQGITVEDPAEIEILSRYTEPDKLAKRRVAAGFPAEGSFNEEMITKLTERDKLQSEIAELEAVRQPVFEQAQVAGVDPATIPAFAESTNPLRQKLRQLEKIQEDVENITVATNLEKLEDELVRPLSKAEALSKIPYEERQFFPSVTKAGENETLYSSGMKSLMEDMGYKKLGQNLLKDITEGKAGDTSKLTIENYIREKGLAQKEERRAAKLKEQTYRADLETALLGRLKNAPDVQNFGNASVITLNSATPMEVAIRDMSTDTAILDHCVGQCGSAPQGRKNILTGKQQNYEPLVDPITGVPGKNAGSRITSYIQDLQSGSELASIRDTKTGLPAATLQFIPYDDSKFNIGYASGAQNRAVDEKYVPAIRDYLNSRADSIRNTGNSLSDNTGIYDSQNTNQWNQVTSEANLTKDQARAFELENDTLPRFVTVKDVKEMAKEIVALNQPAQMSRELADLPYELFLMDVDQDIPNFQAIENTIYGLRNGVIDHAAYRALPENQRAAAMNTTADQLQALVDERRAEMEGGDWEPDPTAVANLPAPQPARQQGQPIPIPEDFNAETLLAEYSDRLSLEQTRWLQNWLDQFDQVAEGSRQEQRLIDVYYEWQEGNTLAPDPTAVANLPAPAARVALDLPPADMEAERVNRLSTEQWSRLNDNLLERVPEEIQRLDSETLADLMTNTAIQEANEIAREAFTSNNFGPGGAPLDVFQRILRTQRAGLHADSAPATRELAARTLQNLHDEAEDMALDFADALVEMYETEFEPPGILRAIQNDVFQLQQRGAEAWESVVGPASEDTPWNPTISDRLIRYLQAKAEEIENEIRENREGPEQYAKGGRVKKPRTSLVVTRKSPELAEMAYRYGGMVI